MKKRGCVLVVDDDPDLRDLVAMTLESDDLEIECAANGLEALAVLERKRPDLILLDMKMPIMDGWEFCRQVAGTDHPPIAVVTAAADPAERAREVNADGWYASRSGRPRCVRS